MRIGAGKYRARFGGIVLICVCTLVMVSSIAMGGEVDGEDQALKFSSTSGAMVRSDAAGSAGTSVTNPLDVPRLLLALGVVLGAIFLLRWIGQRLVLKNGGLRGNKAIAVVSRSMLSHKQQVIMLRVGKRLIVVGDSGGQMNALCEISDPDEVAGIIGESGKESEGKSRKSFGTIFRRAEEPFAESAEAEEPEAAEVPTEPIGLDDAATTREQINGLMSKVQMMRKQFKGA
jgi:flagellar biogenesis protein FliO